MYFGTILKNWQCWEYLCPGCPVSSNHYIHSAEIKKSPKYCLSLSSIKQMTSSAEAVVERIYDFVLTVRGADEGTSLL